MTFICGACDAPTVDRARPCSCGAHCPVPTNPVDPELVPDAGGGLGSGYNRDLTCTEDDEA